MLWLSDQAGGSSGPQEEGIQLCLVLEGSSSREYPPLMMLSTEGLDPGFPPVAASRAGAPVATKCLFHQYTHTAFWDWAALPSPSPRVLHTAISTCDLTSCGPFIILRWALSSILKIMTPRQT